MASPEESMSGAASTSETFPRNPPLPSSDESMSGAPSTSQAFPHSSPRPSSDESMPSASSQDFPQNSPLPSLDEPMADSSFRSFLENSPLPSSEDCIPIMVNACTGQMGMAVIELAETAGLFIVPVSFGSEEKSGKTYEVCGKKFFVQGPSNRESVLKYLLDKYPDLIVVDYTVPSAVNANVELYCTVGVPFVMGTTGGDRDRMFKTIRDSEAYALISQQMGKQAVAFIGILEIMADRFPGLFSGYSLQVIESLDERRVHTTETAKAAISCFNRLGVPFNINEIESIDDPVLQLQTVGIDEDHLLCHEFHVYNLISPDNTAQFEFQLSIGGRSIYAEGTMDAVNFLAKKVQERDDKRMYDMLDVLREGNIE